MRALRRGQASVETLLVFLIFLMVLGVAYFAASRIAAAAQQRMGISLSEKSFSELSAKLWEACSLGNGNVRTVKMEGVGANISASGNSLLFSAGGFSAKVNSSCEISGGVLNAASARIENVGGKLEIS